MRNSRADLQGRGRHHVTHLTIKEKRPVVWADTLELVEAALEVQNLIGLYKVKITADGGQGFFKIILKSQIFQRQQKYTSDQRNTNSSAHVILFLYCLVLFSEHVFEFILCYLLCT